ncbi:MAG: hypothetical protein EOP06_22910 [Proteobacteria bacterium]|nr:MAG: hypothetical protein EOP06_22910 [Pseudomonadota bacterium]
MSVIEKTNSYLEEIDLEKNIVVDLKINKTENEPSIDLSFEVDGLMDPDSTGSQKKLIGYCMDFSVGDLYPRGGLRIVDEPETALDVTNRSKFMHFLKTMSNQQQVIVPTNTAHQGYTYQMISVLDLQRTSDEELQEIDDILFASWKKKKSNVKKSFKKGKKVAEPDWQKGMSEINRDDLDVDMED